MAGFFDRMKDRFTQYAAGTTDLSGLSEDQQKLLRRQAIGRLGASLYRDGDFGAAMAQQEEINAKRNAEQAELARRKQIAEILSPQQQALVGQAPSVAAPQAPTLLRAPGSAGAPGAYGSQDRAPQPSASAQPGQQPTPQQAGALAQEAGAQRARYQRLAEFYHAQGDVDGAKSAIDMANAFAAREEYFAPMAAMVGDREVLLQGSKSGGVNVLGATPTYTDTVRTAIQFGQEPEAFARHLQTKQAGANRVNVNNIPENVGQRVITERDAARLDAMRVQMDTVARALPGLEVAYDALVNNNTGAFAAAILPLQKYLNPDAPEVADATVAASGVITSVLAKLKGVGGNDTEKEMERIMATEPNWQNSPEANRRLFALAIRGMRELEQDISSAEDAFYTNYSLKGWRPTAFRGLSSFGARVEQDSANAQARPVSRRQAWGLEEPN